MKLYYSHRSPYVRLVMVVVHWGNLLPRIELLNTVVNIEKPVPQLMRDNPLTKIPTLLLDNGGVLYDSRVICEYLDDCHDKPKLFPARGEARWTALRRLALGLGLIDLLLSWLLERNRPEAARNPAFIAALETKYWAAVDQMEKEVQTLTSDAFSIGHVAIGTALSYSDFRFPALRWRESHPGLARWQEGFAALPAASADPFFDDLAAARQAEAAR